MQMRLLQQKCTPDSSGLLKVDFYQSCHYLLAFLNLRLINSEPSSLLRWSLQLVHSLKPSLLLLKFKSYLLLHPLRWVEVGRILVCQMSVL